MRKIILIIILAIPLCSISNKLFSQKMQTPLLNHIAVYVNNLEVSTKFYESVIGLSQIPEPFKDGRHTWFTLGSAGQLHLISGAEKGLKREKNSHLCFSVKSIEEFIAVLDKNDVIYENWKGESKSVTLRVDGVKQIYFQDPDGYWIEINNDC
jgi:lactoylglutathione lyase